MRLKQYLDRDIKKAMHQKDKVKLSVLRSLKSMILLAETEKGKVGEIDEEKEKKLLMRAAKQRKESAGIFKKEHRDELYDKEIIELNIINGYLPKPLSKEELYVEIKKIIKQLGVSDSQDIGKTIGIATKTLLGKADGKDISETVKSILLS